MSATAFSIRADALKNSELKWRQRRKPCGEGNGSLTQKQAGNRALYLPAQLGCRKCPSWVAQMNNDLRETYTLNEPTMGFEPMTC